MPNGALQLVEATRDEVVRPVEGAIHGYAQLAGLSHRDDRHHIARFDGFPDIVRVIAAIGQQDAGLWQIVAHDQVEAQIVRCLPRCDVCPHWQACTTDAKVDLGREVGGGPDTDPVDRFPTGRSRTAETLSPSPLGLNQWRPMAQSIVRHQVWCQAGLHRRYQLESRSARNLNPFCQHDLGAPQNVFATILKVVNQRDSELGH